MTIKEFDAYPSYEVVDGQFTTVWGRKLSISLEWVSSARPYALGGPKGTPPGCCITMAGSGTETIINVPYPDFMKMWMEACEK